MVINEKALIREMKEAYKGTGYTVAVDQDDTWTVSCGYWLAQIDGQHNVPNEILSLIVLHMGMLPKAGTAYRVYKTKDGPAVQDEVLSVALSYIKKLDIQRQETEDKPVYIRATRLRLGNCRVWQQAENLQILLIDPRYESVIDSKNNVRIVADTLFKEGEISCVYVCPVSKEQDKAQIQHLEQMQWI